MSKAPRPFSWIKPYMLIFLGVGFVTWIITRDINWSQWTPELLRAKILAWGAWAPVMYIIGYTARVALLIPASLMTLAGVLVFGPWWGTLYVTIGGTLCAAIEFGVVRWLGRETVERLLQRTHLLQRLDQFIASRSFMTVLVLRLVPNAPFEVLNISLGLSPVRWHHFIVATMIGLVPWALIYAVIGLAISDAQDLGIFLLGLLGVILLIWGPVLWRKRHKIIVKSNNNE